MPIVLPIIRPVIRSVVRLPTDAAVGAVVYPLDNAGALPAFAYSTKKLRSAYAGNAFRAVRPSDSATLNVGFVGQNYDAATLATFIGAEVPRIDIWYDQTGNGRDATQTVAADRPLIDTGVLIGGIPALTLNTGWMNLPAGLSTSSRALHHFGVVETWGYSLNETLLMYGTGATFLRFFQQGDELFNNFISTPAYKLQNQPCLYEVRGGVTNSTIAQDGESLVSGAPPSLSTLTSGYIGYMEDAGYRATHCTAAHIGYQRELSAGERTSLRAGLQSLFSLASDTVAKRVSFVGDSIPAQSSGASPYYYGYPRMVERSLPRDVAVYNYGAGGATVQARIPVYTSGGPGRINQAYSDRRITLIAYGTNDISLSGRTSAQIYADLQTYCGLVRTDGAKAIIATVLPNSAFTGPQQTTQTDLNTLIRTNWASFADGLCDFAADPTMGPQSAASNVLLYPDGLHPSRLGHSYLAAVALASINALL